LIDHGGGAQRGPLRVGMVVCSEYESDARVRRQAEALVARGDQVSVYALHASGRPARELVEGVRVTHAPTRKYRGGSARGYLSLYGGFAAHAAKWLASRPRAFDVVQAHSMPEAIVFAAAVQGAVRVPVLLDVHDLTEQLFASKFREGGMLLSAVRMSTRASFAFADEVLTVHEPYADLLRGMTNRRVSVVLNSPDERRFAAGPFRPWHPGGAVVFGYHGLIAPRHGLVNAVEALHALRSEVPGARMLLLGGGDGLDEIATRVGELGLDGVVHLPDRPLPVSEVAAELQGVHIGLIPSQLDPWTSAVLPTKLLEYAAMGIPVITFRNPVIERYFPPESVTYVDPAGPEQLYAAMRGLVADPERARRQAAAATVAMSELTWERQKQRYFDVIDRLAGSRRPRIPRIPRQRRGGRQRGRVRSSDPA
jgi:glycosyltransferase involved in cell wall biosynthesis